MSRPRKVGLTSEEKKFLEVVGKRTVVASKFLDRGTLETLGLWNCMHECLVSAGLGELDKIIAPTFPDIAKEFIATFRIIKKGIDLDAISFKIKGREYVVSAAEARAAIGMNRVPTTQWEKAAPEKDIMALWLGATGQPYDMGNEVSSKITHPCLRLLHKVLSWTIHGHKEDNKVPLKDFRWLYSVTAQARFRPDWLQLLLDGLLKIRGGKPRDITQGGLITMIVQTVCHIGEEEEPLISHMFDAARLQQNSMTKVVKKQVFWTTYSDKSHLMALPRDMPYPHTFNGYNSWYCHPDPTPAPPRTAALARVDDESRPSRRRRADEGSSSQAPVDDTATMDDRQDPPPMEPWQEMMYQQMQAMSLQQTTWQQGYSTEFAEFRTQSFQRYDAQDERLGRIDERQQSMDEYLHQLGEQQYHYFGQHQWPPSGPSSQ